MKKIRNGFNIFISSLLAFILVYAIYVILRYGNVKQVIGDAFGFSFLMLLGIFATGYLCVWKSNKINSTSILIVNVVVLVLQFLILHNIYFKSGWDVEIVANAGYNLAVQGDAADCGWYFGWYPNNAFMCVLIMWIYKIGMFFGVNDVYYLLLIINMLLVNVSGILTYFVTKKMWSEKYANIVFLIWIFCMDFSPWFMVPYTDTFSIPIM